MDSAREDAALLAAHVAGDPDAFGELMRRHRDRMWAVALRTMRDREEAADAVQDACVSALRAAGRFRGDSAVGTWLHRIVVNACLDRMRRRQARPADALGERDVAAPGDAVAASDARLDVHAALARLPEAQRVAVVLVDLEGLSVAEVAAALEVAEGTIKSRCARGRLALRALLAGPATGGNRDAPVRVGPAGGESTPTNPPGGGTA